MIKMCVCVYVNAHTLYVQEKSKDLPDTLMCSLLCGDGGSEVIGSSADFLRVFTVRMVTLVLKCYRT